MEQLSLTDAEKKNIRKLANAMQKGATIRPQIVEVMWGKTDQGVFGSCALGAAWEGSHPDFDVQAWHNVIFYGELGGGVGMEDVCRYFGRLDKIFVRDPIDLSIIGLNDAITDLNDRQGWTREQIADWLLTLV